MLTAVWLSEKVRAVYDFFPVQREWNGDHGKAVVVGQSFGRWNAN